MLTTRDANKRCSSLPFSYTLQFSAISGSHNYDALDPRAYNCHEEVEGGL